MRAWQGPPPSLSRYRGHFLGNYSFNPLPVSVIRLSTQYNFVHAGSELVPVGGDQIHPAALAVQDHGVHTHPSLGLQLTIRYFQYFLILSY